MSSILPGQKGTAQWQQTPNHAVMSRVKRVIIDGDHARWMIATLLLLTDYLSWCSEEWDGDGPGANAVESCFCNRGLHLAHHHSKSSRALFLFHRLGSQVRPSLTNTFLIVSFSLDVMSGCFDGLNDIWIIIKFEFSCSMVATNRTVAGGEIYAKPSTYDKIDVNLPVQLTAHVRQILVSKTRLRCYDLMFFFIRSIALHLCGRLDTFGFWLLVYRLSNYLDVARANLRLGLF